jgi:hypothetical protein
MPFVIATLSAALTVSGTGGCIAATTWHQPAYRPADVIVEAVVTEIEAVAFHRTAKIRTLRRLLGREKIDFKEIWWSTGGGMCGPPSEPPEEGDRLIVYLKVKDGKARPIGWSKIDKAPDLAFIKRQNDEALLRSSP